MSGDKETSSEFPVIPENRKDDVCNLEAADRADLIVFMAGNQFMVMPELIRSFRIMHPEIQTIVYETLPPGLELKQILAGGTVFMEKVYKIQPDVYSSVSEQAMQSLAEQKIIGKNDYYIYLHNRLAIMTAQGNPRQIAGVSDLARSDVVVSQPDPRYEHIANHIMAMYEQAGGNRLVKTIMEKKHEKGTTLFTTVHHRQTPERLVSRQADAGPVWHTEIIEAKRAGTPVDGIEVGRHLDQRENINYFITPVREGKNPENGKKFLDFITSPQTRKIYENHGFIV